MAEKQTVSMPLADAQMLMDWMERTFGNPDGVDWHDEDAGAVGDALYSALDNFRRTQEAIAAAGVKEDGNG